MYLDCEVLKINYGVSYGSTTLKSLQNDNIPELDLLVREAIQNSSDASLEESGKFYSVDFKTSTFVPHEFNDILTGLETVLDEKYPDGSADYLEIRDTQTCGLTGSIRLNDIFENKEDHGNFFRLIYDTGKQQTHALAGGNWGFGKSVYYRVGIGIVIFYSRIKTSDAYEDRLIITLVEDENKKDSNGNDATLLNSIDRAHAGKAWWGSRSEDKKDLLPLTDPELIQSVLDIFDIKPFKSKETGTSIIIPYLDTDRLLKGIIPVETDLKDDVKDHLESVWTSSVADYLRLAIQKWYAPKIHNRELPKFCDNKWLRVSVNNNSISKTDMLPFFRLVQELYTSALAKSYSYDYKSSVYSDIIVSPVNIMNYFESGTTSGYVAMIRISRSDLKGDENVVSPYDYIGKYEFDGGLNEPIVMCARDPGMVIDYSLTGPWVKNITSPESPEDYLFAFFVPNTNKEIKKTLVVKEYAGMKLGAYLRECEASDHMDWNDPVPMEIVKRIRRNTINAVNRQMSKNSPVNIDATASKLSNRLGKNLLPKIGYGKSRGGGGGSGPGGGTKMVNISFEIIAQTIKENEVYLDFVLKLMQGKKKATISMLIASEAGKIDYKSWHEDIGTKFPVEIKDCYIKSLETAVSGVPVDIERYCTSDNPSFDEDEVSVRICAEVEDGTTITQLAIDSHVLNPKISGRLRLKTYDKKYRFTFRVE
jgi:hypothetical protein